MGESGVTGARREQSSNGSISLLWDDWKTADPDDIAIHLWTYSMSTGQGDELPAFYRRLNMAVLEDDLSILQNLRYSICGIIRWIQMHPSTSHQSVVLYRGTPINEKQEHAIGTALNARFSLADCIDPSDGEGRKRAVELEAIRSKRAETIVRMPMFVAASENIKKAQEFCWVRKNGIACPILEFTVPMGCDCVAPIHSMSHFPDEREWLMLAYTPVEYLSQRLEYLEIGADRKIKLVLIVSYKVLNHQAVFDEFESNGQDLKSALIICEPAREAYLPSLPESRLSSAKDSKERCVRVPASRCVRPSTPDRETDDSFAMRLKRAVERGDENAILDLLQETVPIPSNSDPKDFLTNRHLKRIQEFTAALEIRKKEWREKENILKVERVKLKNQLEVLEEKKISFEQLIRKKEGVDSEIYRSGRMIEDTRSRITVKRNDIETIKIRIEVIKVEKVNLEAAIRSFKLQLAALRAEERKAFERFRFRKLSEGLPEGKVAELLPEVEVAGNEYIQSIFPASELEGLLLQVEARTDTIATLLSTAEVYKSELLDMENEVLDKLRELECQKTLLTHLESEISSKKGDFDVTVAQMGELKKVMDLQISTIDRIAKEVLESEKAMWTDLAEKLLKI